MSGQRILHSLARFGRWPSPSQLRHRLLVWEYLVFHTGYRVHDHDLWIHDHDLLVHGRDLWIGRRAATGSNL